MYVADYVLMEYGTGAIMAVPAHDERDFAFAKALRPADPPGRRAARRLAGIRLTSRTSPRPTTPMLVNSGQFDGLTPPAGLRARSSSGSTARASATRPSTTGCATGCVSRQRYWGCPIPIIYCDTLRHGSGARGPAAGDAARRRGLPAQGPLAAGRRRGLGQHHLPASAAATPAARPTRWTRSSTRAGTSCATATPATTTPPGTRRSSRVDARRPVHRRRRARDPAPDVRALLRQGAGRHGPARRAGAVHGAVHAGHDPRPRRPEDVEVARQRDSARRR